MILKNKYTELLSDCDTIPQGDLYFSHSNWDNRIQHYKNGNKPILIMSCDNYDIDMFISIDTKPLIYPQWDLRDLFYKLYHHSYNNNLTVEILHDYHKKFSVFYECYGLIKKELLTISIDKVYHQELTVDGIHFKKVGKFIFIYEFKFNDGTIIKVDNLDDMDAIIELVQSKVPWYYKLLDLI